MGTPDDPTRRIPPNEVPPPPAPRPGEPRLTEREYAAAPGEPDPWHQEILDRISSLKTWLGVLTVLTLIALGLAAYTLATAEEEDDTRAGASREQVRDLSDRVNELEGQVEDAPSDDAVSDTRSSVRDLEERVQAVEQAAEEGGDGASQEQVDELTTAVEQLDAAVTELEERQDQLEQEQQQQP